MKYYFFPALALALLPIPFMACTPQEGTAEYEAALEGECVTGELHCPEVVETTNAPYTSVTRVPVPGGYIYHFYKIEPTGTFVQDCNAPHIDDNPGICWVD